MAKRNLKAAGSDKELQHIYKPTKKFAKRFFKAIGKKDNAVFIMCVLAGVPPVLLLVGMLVPQLSTFSYPASFDVCRFLFFFFVLPVFWIMNNKKSVTLPLKLPKHSGLVDYNDPLPGRNGYNKADGIFYLGNDENGYELWLKDTDIKTHMLIYGTTGSGKTVTLQSVAFNAFGMSTGLCYIDPKGDPKLAHELFIMARRVAREDDFLALDFMTSGIPVEEYTPFRMSNTTNPFSQGSADSITNLITSLLPKDEGGNAVFQQKAVALLTALVPILAKLRDAQVSLPLTDMSNVNGINRPKGKLGAGMSIMTIRDFMEPAACVSLVFPMKGGGNKGSSGSSVKQTGSDSNAIIEECDEIKKYVDEPILDVMKAALSSLNYAPGGAEVLKQQSYLDQFGYAKGYFGAPLAQISGTYKHLFNVANGEVDMYDVLFNRRILVGILPSLEKSPVECENLGKIILASVKNSVAGGLGTRLEGKTKEVTGALPSASKTPGIIVVDEYAAIMMPGFEVILTQARSLGFMAIIASQDYSGMKGKDAKSCDQIVENTKIKLFMTMASAKETWDLAKSLFGSMNVEEIDLNNPEDRGTIKNIDKVNQYDLMSQIEGEFHAFYKGDLIRGRTQYMILKVDGKHNMRINRFVGTDKSPDLVKENLKARELELSESSMTAEADIKWREELAATLPIANIFFLNDVGEESMSGEAA